MGPVALSVGATFVAYLIGTTFNEVRKLFAGAYLKTRRTVGQEPAAKRAEALAKVEEESREQRERWENRMKAFVDRLSRKHSSPERNSESTSGLIGEVVLGFTSALGAAIVLPSVFLRSSSRLFSVFLEANEAVATRMVRGLASIRIEPYKPFLSTQGVEAIQRYLMNAHGDISISPWPTVADVIADFPVIRNRLIHTSSATVSEIDRLYAEAEFRASIVPPLFFIGGLLCIEVSWWWALTAPLLLALSITARARRREAGDLMADAVSREVVTAPSVEFAFDRAVEESRGIAA